MTEKLSFDALTSHLFGAADILRKKLNPEEYRPVIMTVLFIKRLNDEYEANVQKLIQKGKSEKEARKKFNHAFTISDSANWDTLFKTKKSIGQKLNQISRYIEEENPRLAGVLTATKFDDKRNYPDNTMEDLVVHFNKHNLSNDNLVKPDIFGDAYEYLLAEFASETKKKGGQFYTPHEVVRLLVLLTKPKEGMRICDPTCGSGGMLIQSWSYVKEKGGKADNLTLHGQESNYQTVGMSKMNLVLHGVANFKIEHEDVLEKPLLQEGGKLFTYDRVLANYPFSENWKAEGKESDVYNRFKFGIPPAKDKADFAFIQHMYATLNDKGQAAIISSQGVLFRGGVEAAIRQGLFEEDAVEAIIALPQKMFYGTSIPGCILLLNKNKAKERKGKILFIYAAKDYKEEKVRNILRDEDLTKITKAVADFKDIDRYCHVADKEELEENEFNFNVPRYVDISEPEEPVDIQKTIDEIKKLDKEREGLEKKVQADLKELGFKI
ncbi:SAM-dependent DNA methyltransferase [Marine Group I thaumarchaeote]|uniref:site-specific DNA-methyltransferase (adenine-specific) n=1 Tax=Marine Group I thaumarchaeote TaxID=2511932 RepID=A0A7K4NG80_9ARCH|nr:SAM-dependent DNA methyltransferase [Marine Group I thaumarchaeote]NWK00295.1 SAM-dependent DNA methyltransferase [Marine Group I thaumarchaeote]NWK13420.1 SAM-dependent DNA methyltransferase [Marine Group I thaumarchaeote]